MLTFTVNVKSRQSARNNEKVTRARRGTLDKFLFNCKWHSVTKSFWLFLSFSNWPLITVSSMQMPTKKTSLNEPTHLLSQPTSLKRSESRSRQVPKTMHPFLSSWGQTWTASEKRWSLKTRLRSSKKERWWASKRCSKWRSLWLASSACREEIAKRRQTLPSSSKAPVSEKTRFWAQPKSKWTKVTMMSSIWTKWC